MMDMDRYLCFSLAAEEFAIPLLSVKEVIGVPEVTPIPQAQPHFVGIMNLRGNVISILDLRLKLGHKSSKTDETTVIVLDLGDYNIGVLVDSVNSVVSVNKEDVSPKPAMDAKATDYIVSVFRKSDRLVLMLDIAKALSVEDRSAIKKATSSNLKTA